MRRSSYPTLLGRLCTSRRPWPARLGQGARARRGREAAATADRPRSFAPLGRTGRKGKVGRQRGRWCAWRMESPAPRNLKNVLRSHGQDGLGPLARGMSGGWDKKKEKCRTPGRLSFKFFLCSVFLLRAPSLLIVQTQWSLERSVVAVAHTHTPRRTARPPAAPPRRERDEEMGQRRRSSKHVWEGVTCPVNRRDFFWEGAWV